MSLIDVSAVRQIDEWIKARQLDVEQWATRSQYRELALQRGTNSSGGQASINAEFQDIVKRYGYLDAVHIVDASGLALASSNAKVIGVMNIAQRPYFKETMQGHAAISDVVISLDRGMALIVIAAPLQQDGQTVGAVVCGLKLDSLCRKFVDTTRVCQSGHLFICDGQGRYLADPDTNRIFKVKLADSTWGQQVMKDKQGSLSYRVDGADHFVTFDASPSLGWIVAVTVPLAELNAPIKAIAFNNLVLVAIALAGGLGVAVWLARSISVPIQHYVTSLYDSARQLDDAAGQIATASQSLAEGASEQAASLEETSASLEEMTSMTRSNAENAQSAKNLANQTRQAADTGGADMHQMGEAMETIKAASADISKIIKTIDEIAFQTNILALNAAVEAARAGEAGLGFAVVADEVRNLAQRSAHAARETADKIEGAIGKTQVGVDISAKVSRGLGDILSKVRQVDALITEVASASREQSQGVNQVNTAVSQMDKVTQSNAAHAEECASAAEELKAQSSRLGETVRGLSALIGNGSLATDRTALGITRHPTPFAKTPVG